MKKKVLNCQLFIPFLYIQDIFANSLNLWFRKIIKEKGKKKMKDGCVCVKGLKIEKENWDLKEEKEKNTIRKRETYNMHTPLNLNLEHQTSNSRILCQMHQMVLQISMNNLQQEY